MTKIVKPMPIRNGPMPVPGAIDYLQENCRDTKKNGRHKAADEEG